MRRSGRTTTYTLLWTLLLLLFLGGVWWGVDHAPVRSLTSNEFSSKATTQQNQQAPSIDESLSATDIDLKQGKLTVNGDDGRITMVASIAEGVKKRNLYSINNGRMTFLLKSKRTGAEKETLVLQLNNATYTREAGLVKVRGTLIGQIAEGGHYFKAEELSWDQSEQRVSTKEISYRGPGIDVSGKQMSIDLETGEVRFDGPVDVGI
jgi:hypothetical protein